MSNKIDKPNSKLKTAAVTKPTNPAKAVDDGINTIDEIQTSIKLNKAKGPATALLVFAHGAGAGMDHEFIVKMSALITQQNIHVLCFNFPYMDKRKVDGKRRPPDRMPKLLASYHQLLKETALKIAAEEQLPIFVGGKSIGARVAATLFSEDNESASVESHLLEAVKGIICLGYPFHPPKKTEKLRLAPLQSNNRPVCVLQGVRDSLGAKDEIKTYALNKSVQVQYFEDGDHDLKPRVKSGYTQDQHMKNAAIEIRSFINETLGS